jgi:hypothetical protein
MRIMILTAAISTNQMPSWPMILFAMVFSLGLALFYTLFIGYFLEKLASKEIKPGWLFYALLPAIVGVCGAYKVEWSFYAIVGLFLLLFLAAVVLMAIGGIASAFGSFLKYRRDKAAGKYKALDEKPLWQKILGLLAAIGLFIAFFSGTQYFVMAIFVLILFSSLVPTPKSTFLDLQANLPTSKIRSMAMGLVEVKGRAMMNTPLKAPIDDKPCIGYRYTIETITKDDEGRESFSTIEDTTCCNSFIIRDDTGSVSVKADGISFVSVGLDGGYRSNQKRYQQYLLFDGDEILLIGSAGLDGSTPVIEKEKFRDILVLAPANYVHTWNVFRPLVRAYTVWIMMLALTIAAALMIPMRIENGKIVIHIDQSFSGWGENTIADKDQEALDALEIQRAQEAQEAESQSETDTEGATDAYMGATSVIHTDEN